MFNKLLHEHPLIGSSNRTVQPKLASQDEVSWYASFRHTAVITAGAVPDSMRWAGTPDAIAIGQPTILNHGTLKMGYEGGHI